VRFILCFKLINQLDTCHDFFLSSWSRNSVLSFESMPSSPSLDVSGSLEFISHIQFLQNHFIIRLYLGSMSSSSSHPISSRFPCQNFVCVCV
jgi:hypothetical protein